MRVCDVVLNSIWYDPRVRKQIIEYKENNIEVSCVGLKCNRYNDQEVQKIPCRTTITEIPEKYDGKQKTVFGKLRREIMKSAQSSGCNPLLPILLQKLQLC